MERSSSAFNPLNVLVVVRDAPILVAPAKVTPSRRFFFPVVNVFSGFGSILSSHTLLFDAPPGRHLDDNYPAHTIRQALEKLLVPYYPFAGRLRPSGQHGKLEVVCDGQGVLFVDAYANITMVELKRLDRAFWSEFQFDEIVDDSTDVVPLVVQLTKLACGGFVLSIRLLHSLCDSSGILHFLRGWSELARGEEQVSTLPIWGTELPRSTIEGQRFHFPTLALAHILETMACRHEKHDFRNLVPITQISFSSNDIRILTRLLRKEGSRKCNTFEALAAHVWRERTRALDIPASSEVRLFFPTPVSHDLPMVFYGQYAFNTQAITTVGYLLQNDLAHAVQLIQKASKFVEEGFTKCVTDFADAHCPAGCAPYTNLIFTLLTDDLSKIGFGSGMPPYTADAVRLHSPVNAVSITNVSEDSLELLVTNIPANAVESFKHNVHDLSSLTDSRL